MMPCTIILTEFEAQVPRPGNQDKPGAGPRLRRRWRARFEGARRPFADVTAVGETVDVAIGQLVREAAVACDTADDVIDLVAGLFSDLAIRTADEAMGKAVRTAASTPTRRPSPTTTTATGTTTEATTADSGSAATAE